MSEKRFWLSWIQVTDDYRPLTDPPHANVLGWWCSGYDQQDKAILCALVKAHDLRSAKRYVRKSWPEVSLGGEWRIESLKRLDWLPGDRFPLSDWMIERTRGAR